MKAAPKYAVVARAARGASEWPRRRASKIIDAAARVFAERGYHGASTQAIADVLGIRQASLYYYFPSKDIALEQVCLRGVEGYIERAQAIASGEGGAAEQLRRIIFHHLLPMVDRADFVRVFQRERRYLPDASRRRIGRLSRKYERIVQDVIEAGVRSREFRKDLDARLAALAVLGMCNAATAWYGIEPDASVERITGQFAKFVSAGLLARLHAVSK